jgi:predicted GNAT family N-acyltransferase
MEDLAGAFSFHRATSVWPSLDDNTNNANHIAIATTPDDLRKVGALRYSMYVERDKKVYAHVDPSKRCFLEPVDLVSLNLMASKRGECLAGLRLTKAREALKDVHLKRLLANTPIASSEFDNLVVSSRFVVAESVHARLQTVALLQEAYRVSLLHGAATGIIATRLALVPFFVRIGFVACATTYVEQIAGELAVLRFDFRNRQRLASMFREVHDNITATERIETTP